MIVKKGWDKSKLDFGCLFTFPLSHTVHTIKNPNLRPPPPLLNAACLPAVAWRHAPSYQPKLRPHMLRPSPHHINYDDHHFHYAYHHHYLLKSQLHFRIPLREPCTSEVPLHLCFRITFSNRLFRVGQDGDVEELWCLLEGVGSPVSAFQPWRYQQEVNLICDYFNLFLNH